MLSRELTQVAESGTVGSQISEYICHTFLGNSCISMNILLYCLIIILIFVFNPRIPLLLGVKNKLKNKISLIILPGV